jgi:hypothetical protein
MAKLAMQQAPAPAVPRRFLRSASAWGVIAGALLALDGGAAIASRWSGSTLALVHALTLGVLGNAMVGSLLQFLPVAAGVRVRGGRGAALWLHGLLNAGALLLVAAFRWPALLAPQWGGGAVGAAFALLVALVLPGLWAAQGQRFLRWGMGAALLAAAVAAALGLLLALALSGRGALPLPAFTDVHAGWGVLGWVLGLLAAVARVVMPMFQGTSVPSVRAQGAWHAALYALLLLATVAALRGVAIPALRAGAGVLGLAFVLAGLLLQLRAPKRRVAPLTLFWRAGFLALAAAACALLAGGEVNALRAGVLALGIGLPLLVTGMQLEIAAFLGWIDVQRRCGRGVHLPGVQLLLPARDKSAVLALHGVSAVVLVAALAWPVLARVAGLALALAHAAGFAALWSVDRRAGRFVEAREVHG